MTGRKPTREEAIEQGRREGIPPEDAGALYDKLDELYGKVARGEIEEITLIKEAQKFARDLAQKRKLREIMSPNLDVITGKLR